MNKVLSLFSMLMLTSCCTLSLTNISTLGEATDILDSEQNQEGSAELEATFPEM